MDLPDDLLARIAPMTLMPELKGKGVYLFCLRECHALPDIEVGAHGVVYVGMTEKSLLVRNHFLHAHSGGSTLRRSLGALLRETLKLEPIRRDAKPENASKFRFADDGEARLTEWMKANLLAAQTEISGDVRSKETALIQEWEPPLNLTKWINPQKALVSAKRKACTNIVLASFRR